MSTSTSRTTAAALAQVQALMAGMQKHFPSGTFTLEGASYTTVTLLQTLGSLADALSGVLAAHAGLKASLLTLAKVAATIGPVEKACRGFVVAAYGNSPQQLADFGVPPRKQPAPRTSEQKAAAAAKAKATRIAQGTKSRKQKLAVKGDLTGVAITPVTSPAAVAASSSPSARPATGQQAVPPQGAAK